MKNIIFWSIEKITMVNKTKYYIFSFIILFFIECNMSLKNNDDIIENKGYTFLNELKTINIDSLKDYSIEKRYAGYLFYYFDNCSYVIYYIENNSKSDTNYIIKNMKVDSVFHNLNGYYGMSHNKIINYNTFIYRINIFNNIRLDKLYWDCEDKCLIFKRGPTTLLFDDTQLMKKDTIYKNKKQLAKNWYLMN
jgi:hypothetical protein